MKFKKIVLFLSWLSISLSSFAQSNKMQENETKNVVVQNQVSENEKTTNLDTQPKELNPTPNELNVLAGLDEQEEVVLEEKTETILNEELIKLETEAIKTMFIKLNDVFAKKENEKLSTFFSDKFIFVQSDQSIYLDIDSLGKYFFQKTKFETFVDFVDISLNENIEVYLSSNGLGANIVGKGNEKYSMGKDEYILMPVRWTANVEKVDNNWKIKSIHFGADHLRNPILSNYEDFGMKVGVITFFIALTLGILLSFVFLRIIRKSNI